jgi:bifunctional non-homologous end joining protein LigD
MGKRLDGREYEELRWQTPETVAQFRFLEWTSNDHLRHASFLGLRNDKEARSIIKEQLSSDASG